MHTYTYIHRYIHSHKYTYIHTYIQKSLKNKKNQKKRNEKWYIVNQLQLINSGPTSDHLLEGIYVVGRYPTFLAYLLGDHGLIWITYICNKSH